MIHVSGNDEYTKIDEMEDKCDMEYLEYLKQQEVEVNTKKIGKLGYNSNNARMGILNKLDLWENNGLHCGQTIEVLINEEWKTDSLEFTKGNWYLVNSGLIGDQIEGLKIRF